MANGTKLSVRNGNIGYDYDGSFVYTVTDNTLTLEAAHFAGGQLKPTGVNYTLTDHLGSIRSIVDAGGEVQEQNDYYPFGSRHLNTGYVNNGNRYTFSGKERQDLSDLNRYDFGARMYDSDIARWATVDPLAEDYYAQSLFEYCDGNPVRYVDFNGEMKVIYNPDGTYKETTHNNWFHNTFLGLNTYIDYGDGNVVQLSEGQFWLWQRTGKYDSIEPIEDGSAAFWELYINEPAENWLDAGDKFIASNFYSIINSPKVLFTGKTLSGSSVTPYERVGSFIDVASSYLNRFVEPISKLKNPGSWYQFKRSNMHIPVKDKKAAYDGAVRVFKEESKHIGVHKKFFDQINRVNEFKNRESEIK